MILLPTKNNSSEGAVHKKPQARGPEVKIKLTLINDGSSCTSISVDTPGHITAVLCFPEQKNLFDFLISSDKERLFTVLYSSLRDADMNYSGQMRAESFLC